MRYKKAIYIGLLTVFGVHPNIFAQETGLSFSQAKDLMSGNNKQFQINQKKLETSKFDEKISKSLRQTKRSKKRSS